jgi:hypothetical protein
MADEMNAVVRMETNRGLSEQDIRAIIACSEHPEFTRVFLKDIKSTEKSVPNRTAHTQWSKS